MFDIFLLSHGNLAKGLHDALIMIMGEQRNIKHATFTEDYSLESYELFISEKLNYENHNRKVLFLCDLYGGTPHNVAVKFKLRNTERFEVISGVNLPVLMTAITKRHLDLKAASIEIIKESKEAIQLLQINDNKKI